MEKKDVIIIGGGPAGLATAITLYKRGITDILILEREKQMGGILRQCIHDGFGLTRFGETLSGPEYAQRFIDEVKKLGIPYMTDVKFISIYTPGDVRLDGAVSAVDLVALKRAVQMNETFTTKAAKKAADADESGAINMDDCEMVRVFLVR